MDFNNRLRPEQRMAKKGGRTVCLTFPPELIRYLDGLAWELLKKSGASRRLHRMALLRALVQVFKEGNFDLAGVRTERDFVRTVLHQIRGHRRRPARL